VNTPPIIGISGRAEPFHPPLSPLIYGTPQGYVTAVREAQGLPLVFPPILEETDIPHVLATVDGVILSGGGDIAPSVYGEPESDLALGIDSARDRAEIALAHEALRVGLPILAICRGIQVLNVVLGGTLYLDIEKQVEGALPHRPEPGQPLTEGPQHTVAIAPDSKLADIAGEESIVVNSFHHQAVRRVGRDLIVTARAPDGVIEALEHRDHPFCVGVQWHPEIVASTDQVMTRLFSAFVRAAAAYRGP
jgi:putative glutamine amidotransferase